MDQVPNAKHSNLPVFDELHFSPALFVEPVGSPLGGGFPFIPQVHLVRNHFIK